MLPKRRLPRLITYNWPVWCLGKGVTNYYADYCTHVTRGVAVSHGFQRLRLGRKVSIVLNIVQLRRNLAGDTFSTDTFYVEGTGATNN